MRRPFLVLLSLAALFSTGCGEQEESGTTASVESARTQSEPSPAKSAPTAVPRAIDPPTRFAEEGRISDTELANYHVELGFSVDGQPVGELSLELWSEAAPITVRNFLRLCDEGFYKGLKMHRILRNFMVQGGDPTNTGGGDSPYGRIRGELSDEPERDHAYGVIAMARKGGDNDSASCQFFICCNESPQVWNLDGKYASFGRITSGIETLEALANTPTAQDGRENSSPSVPVKITSTKVVEGPPPSGEVIAYPEPEITAKPKSVVVQHILLAFQGVPKVPSTRSREEAHNLAHELLDKARAGEDFEALLIEHSDDPVQAGDETPGTYRLNNAGYRNIALQRKAFDTQIALQAESKALQAKLEAGEISEAEFQQQGQWLGTRFQEAQQSAGAPRDQMVKGFGDTAFSLEVGEVELLEHDPTLSPFGWHIIRRLE